VSSVKIRLLVAAAKLLALGLSLKIGFKFDDFFDG
jgi:hypothetical protein